MSELGRSRGRVDRDHDIQHPQDHPRSQDGGGQDRDIQHSQDHQGPSAGDNSGGPQRLAFGRFYPGSARAFRDAVRPLANEVRRQITEPLMDNTPIGRSVTRALNATTTGRRITGVLRRDGQGTTGSQESGAVNPQRPESQHGEGSREPGAVNLQQPASRQGDNALSSSGTTDPLANMKGKDPETTTATDNSPGQPSEERTGRPIGRRRVWSHVSTPEESPHREIPVVRDVSPFHPPEIPEERRREHEQLLLEEGISNRLGQCKRRNYADLDSVDLDLVQKAAEVRRAMIARHDIDSSSNSQDPRLVMLDDLVRGEYDPITSEDEMYSPGSQYQTLRREFLGELRVKMEATTQDGGQAG